MFLYVTDGHVLGRKILMGTENRDIHTKSKSLFKLYICDTQEKTLKLHNDFSLLWHGLLDTTRQKKGMAKTVVNLYNLFILVFLYILLPVVKVL
jgi:hypothetical protein